MLPSGAIEIKGLAVNFCSNIKLIYITLQVEIIQNNAFYNCPKLNIYCEVKEKPLTRASKWNIDDIPVVWGFNIKENI